MKLKLILGCLILLMVVSIDGFGQRKKKNPYEGYWEQQEKQEQFDKIAKEALVLFQAKNYENAKNKYSAALKIIPTDQRVIAKIRDIDLLIEKQKHAQMQQQSFTPEHTIEESKEEEEEEVPDTLTLYLNTPIQTEAETTDTSDALAPVINSKPTDKPVEKVPEIVPKKPVAKKVTTPPTPKKENPKPYKNTDNYRKYLATIYKAGWTEEKYTEGKKEIIKRVFVQEKYGEEYLSVKHHYGAVYYFKNGASISYATWVAETEKEAK